jgi:3-oxoacyl-[acyl-carrier protein] reductase
MVPSVPRLTSASRSVAGRVVLVTGAASGMGRATARLLADEGAVVGLIDREAGGLEAVAAELAEAGATAHHVVADLAERAAIGSAVAAFRGALGPIDGLVNNAG